MEWSKVSLLTATNTPDNLLDLIKGKVRIFETKVSFTSMYTDKAGIYGPFLTVFEQNGLFQINLLLLVEILGWSHIWNDILNNPTNMFLLLCSLTLGVCLFVCWASISFFSGPTERGNKDKGKGKNCLYLCP